MRAVRKRHSGPGLVLDEVPVPTPGPAEVLVRIEAASIRGTDLHIHRWDKWSSERVHPPLTLGHELCGTVVAAGREVRDVEEGAYVSSGEPRHVRHLLPLPHGPGAHVSGRESSASIATGPTTSRFPRPSSGATTARSSRRRSRASRSRSGTPSSRRAPRAGRPGRCRPRLRAGRALHDRDRPLVRLRASARIRPRVVPARAARQLERTRSSTSTRPKTSRPGSSSRTRAWGWESSSRCRGR